MGQHRIASQPVTANLYCRMVDVVLSSEEISTILSRTCLKVFSITLPIKMEYTGTTGKPEKFGPAGQGQSGGSHLVRVDTVTCYTQN